MREIINFIGESTLLAKSGYLSKDNIVPVLILIIVLRLIKYVYQFLIARLPLERTKTHIDLEGNSVTTVEKFRDKLT